MLAASTAIFPLKAYSAIVPARESARPLPESFASERLTGWPDAQSPSMARSISLPSAFDTSGRGEVMHHWGFDGRGRTPAPFGAGLQYDVA